MVAFVHARNNTSGFSLAVTDVESMRSCLASREDPMRGGYFEALRTVNSVRLTREGLTLSGPGTELNFRSVELR
jgi:hypothetical protein